MWAPIGLTSKSGGTGSGAICEAVLDHHETRRNLQTCQESGGHGPLMFQWAVAFHPHRTGKLDGNIQVIIPFALWPDSNTYGRYPDQTAAYRWYRSTIVDDGPGMANQVRKP